MDAVVVGKGGRTEMELIPGIRIAVRAVIVHDGALLVQRKVYEGGSIRYTLPGGAPNLGESLEEGLIRECHEELGVAVEIAELMHVADFHKPRDTTPPTKRQQVEVLFRCLVPPDYEPRNGAKPDKHQMDVIWLQPGDVEESPLFPRSWKNVLFAVPAKYPVYLGLVD